VCEEVRTGSGTTDVDRADPCELAQRVRSGQVTAHETLAAAAAHAREADRSLRAVRHWFRPDPGPDGPERPFAGVPCLVKNLAVNRWPASSTPQATGCWRSWATAPPPTAMCRTPARSGVRHPRQHERAGVRHVTDHRALGVPPHPQPVGPPPVRRRLQRGFRGRRRRGNGPRRTGLGRRRVVPHARRPVLGHRLQADPRTDLGRSPQRHRPLRFRDERHHRAHHSGRGRRARRRGRVGTGGPVARAATGAGIPGTPRHPAGTAPDRPAHPPARRRRPERGVPDCRREHRHCPAAAGASRRVRVSACARRDAET
jgi:hypothetical protein